MTQTPTPGVLRGIATALPIMMGYFPVAFSFGVGATKIGMTVTEATAFSLIVFAGAAQFMALALISSGTPVLIAAFTLVAMNIRHVIYGPTLMRAAGPEAATRSAWAWTFALTDEVFGAALGLFARGDARFSERFMFGLGFASYAAWVGGTLAGAWAGGGALESYPAVDAALGFMLPALFLALLMSILSRQQVPVIVVAGLVTGVATLAASSTAGILAGMVAGAVAGTLGLGARKGGGDEG